jgi:hypothetical protein
MYGKNGKYTDKIRWYHWIIIIVFVLFFASLTVLITKEAILVLEDEIVAGSLMLIVSLILAGLTIFLITAPFRHSKKVTNWELSEKGYVTTETNSETNEVHHSEFLFTSAIKCLISPLSVSIYQTNSNSFNTKIRYHKYVTLNIVYRKEDGELDVFQFSHYSEEELYPWLLHLQNHNVPIEITVFELTEVPAIDFLDVVSNEVDRRPYVLKNSLKDLGLKLVTTEKPNLYTLAMTKRLMHANLFVEKKLGNKLIFSAQFFIMVLFLLLFHNQYNSDETLTWTTKVTFYFIFTIFLTLYLYGVPQLKKQFYFKFAGVFILQWISAIILVNYGILNIPETFEFELLTHIIMFMLVSPLISILAYMIRDIKPAIYHEKYRKDLEKLNQNNSTAAS